MPKEVELIPRGDRGFVSFGAPIETDAPSAPQVLSDGRVSMSAHISIEDAKELRRRLEGVHRTRRRKRI